MKRYYAFIESREEVNGSNNNEERVENHDE